MAWTAPRTWVTSEVVSASTMNTHVRDNLLETAPAKATSTGGIIYGAGTNTVVERAVNNDSENTSEGTSSSTYTNLATVGPSVSSITTGTKVLVIVSARVTSTSAGCRPSMSYQVSGASSISATEEYGFQNEINASGDFRQGSHAAVIGLTAGSNTFIAKYASLGGTGTATFHYRKISVLPAN